MIQITERICVNNSRYKAHEPLVPTGVVLHSIGCPQPNAEVLVRSWENNNSPYCTHYILDDHAIYHCMPNNLKCWHVSSPGNSKWLGIEMGEPSWLKLKSTSAGTGGGFTMTDPARCKAYLEAEYRNAVQLIAKLCKDYGWDPNTAIFTHKYITDHKLSNCSHIDPEHIWKGCGLDYCAETLRRDVAAEMKIPSSYATPVPSSTPVAEPKKEQLYRVRLDWQKPETQIGAWMNLDYAIAGCKGDYKVFDEHGKVVYPVPPFVPYLVRIKANSGLNVRSKPSTDGKIRKTLGYGGGYTIVEVQGDWGLLKSYSKNRDGWIYLRYTEKV